MSVLVIGGDKITRLELFLASLGTTETYHWDSRRNSTSHKSLPKNTDMIIMLTDYLKHNSMNHFKREAKKKDIPFLCVKGMSGCSECQISQMVEGIRQNKCVNPSCQGGCK